jgi:hypothetical protein
MPQKGPLKPSEPITGIRKFYLTERKRLGPIVEGGLLRGFFGVV